MEFELTKMFQFSTFAIVPQDLFLLKIDKSVYFSHIYVYSVKNINIQYHFFFLCFNNSFHSVANLRIFVTRGQLKKKIDSKPEENCFPKKLIQNW